jgi:hypothetical protein
LIETKRYHSIAGMRKKTVMSLGNLTIGQIIDVVFDQDLQIHSFIIGGSRWEELRESLGIIDDIDPVIPVDKITEIKEDTINVKILKTNLQHKLEEGVIPEKSFTYKDLKRKKILDSKDNKFGKIVNMGFLPSGEPVLIVGGKWFEELTERLGFRKNIDLLLPFDKIDTIDEKIIRLNVPIDELKLTLDNKPMTALEQENYLNSIDIKGQAEMRLLDRQKGEVFKHTTRFN